MIKRSEIQKLVREYSDLTVGALGSHSALEIMDGAKDENLQTLVVCQKGRETPYKRFRRISDEIILVNKFKEMLSNKIQSRLRSSNTIIVPHRALTAYLGYEAVENKVSVTDWHATILHLLGLHHESLFIERNGLKERLTGVTHPRVVTEVIA